mmetsp:Transcript_38662/g.111686  ORF Transcript_38662/g.111686 Transcript_38662/m.111686 type:complete len:84 (+) Transcript_38662:75-326(+)
MHRFGLKQAHRALGGPPHSDMYSEKVCCGGSSEDSRAGWGHVGVVLNHVPRKDLRPSSKFHATRTSRARHGRSDRNIGRCGKA